MSDDEELDVSSFSINRGWRDRRLSQEAGARSRLDGLKADNRFPSPQGSRAFGRGFRGSNWRGSRGGRGGFDPKKQAPSISNRPLGKLVATVNRHLLDEVNELAGIGGCEYVASYNWLDRKEPTILVPGMPPRWSPMKETRKIPEDSGEYFRDPNAARYPICPIEPGIRALLKMRPGFDFGALHVVACGSTLGNLLRFARSIDWNFRFDVELVGGTLFLIRKEHSPTQLIENVRGFGHTFPEANTSWNKEVRGSVSHQRLISYSIGGLKCLVRSESDGYLEDLVEAPISGDAKNDTCKKAEKHKNPLETCAATQWLDQVSVSGLSDALDSFLVQETLTESSTSQLVMQVQGSPIPQKAVFDLKTRSAKRELEMEEILPRLWVNQIPNLIVGYHNSGLFDDIRIEAVQGRIREWEAQNVNAINRLIATLQQIVAAVKGSDKKRLEIVRLGVDSLDIRERTDGDQCVVPSDLEALWNASAQF